MSSLVAESQRLDSPSGPVLDATSVIDDVHALLATEIFSSGESAGPLFRAAFVWLVLNVHDLLQEADRRGSRIVLVEDGSEDVTDLIGRARYAIVHAAGGLKRRSATRIPALSGKQVMVGEHSGHADDIAIDLGTVRIRIRRDLVWAFEAARLAFMPD